MKFDTDIEPRPSRAAGRSMNNFYLNNIEVICAEKKLKRIWLQAEVGAVKHGLAWVTILLPFCTLICIQSYSREPEYWQFTTLLFVREKILKCDWKKKDWSIVWQTVQWYQLRMYFSKIKRSLLKLNRIVRKILLIPYRHINGECSSGQKMKKHGVTRHRWAVVGTSTTRLGDA